jgi:uncharacterized protein
MKETFQNLIAYLKNPILEKDPNTDLNYRFKIFFQILVIDIITIIPIVILFYVFEELKWVTEEDFIIDSIFENWGYIKTIIFGAIVAPIIEELLFRAPLTTFTKPKSFKIAFYTFAVFFGFIHITNYELSTKIILLSPILILPQLLGAGYLGYLRVRFGLRWSILMHATFNFLLVNLEFLFD